MKQTESTKSFNRYAHVEHLSMDLYKWSSHPIQQMKTDQTLVLRIHLARYSQTLSPPLDGKSLVLVRLNRKIKT